MLHLKNYLKSIILVSCIFFAASLRAAVNEELISLEAEMLKYIDTNDREAFIRASEKLIEASKEAEDERMLFKAWGNQGIYEATHQNYEGALETAKKMIDYARQEGSTYGEYAGMHIRAMALFEQQNYDEAQRAFLEAIDFRRRHFPNESSAEDLQELMKIAYYRGDITTAKKYGYQMLAEPNVTPHHKGRALSRLSIMAFEENNVEEFNHVYEEMNRLTQTDGIKLIDLFTEVNYHIINADYKQALLLVDRLAVDTCAERKAIIYHRLGDNEKAYEYMVLFKHISDSIERASHSRDVASLYLRMNNDRLRLESELLTQQNGNLRHRYYFAVGTILILILLFIIYQRHKIVRMLKRDNTMLNYGKKGAERTLKELHELSFYESKTDMPLNIPLNINRLCDHLTSVIQKHCYRGVTTIFQSEFPDDFEILTNPEALEKLLTHLLNNSSHYTEKGIIWLKCANVEKFVRFSISDTSLGHDNPTNEDSTAQYSNINLNICQSISHQLRGRIWRDTEYTGGIRYIFEIPKNCN
jgi:signal transduction histidine kinase